MQQLFDILQNKDFDMPAEIKAIKDYARRHYDADVDVKLQQRAIIISARSAALIGTLRANAPALQRAAQTEKSLVFRIR